MNFAVLLTFLCSIVLLVVSEDEAPTVMNNPTVNNTPSMHDSHDHGDHDGHDHDGHDHSMMAVTTMAPTSSNGTVKDPSAQGSMKGGAIPHTACLSIVLLAATFPLLL